MNRLNLMTVVLVAASSLAFGCVEDVADWQAEGPTLEVSHALAGENNIGYGQLDWGDFQGEVPDNTNGHAAEIETEVSYGVTVADPTDNGDGTYTVSVEVTDSPTATMNPDESWVEPGSESDELLNHEQGHFDIAESHAQEMNTELEGISEVTVEAGSPEEALQNAGDKVEEEMADNYEAMKQEQEKYDDETDHGTDEEAQAEWDKKLKDRLNPPDNSRGSGTGEGFVEFEGFSKRLFLWGASLLGFTIPDTESPADPSSEETSEGISIEDQALQGGSVDFPPMILNTLPHSADMSQFFAQDDDATISVWNGDGSLAIEGDLNYLMADPSRPGLLVGYIEGPVYYSSSPYVDYMADVTTSGQGAMMIEFQMDDDLASTTQGWNDFAFTSGLINLTVTAPTANLGNGLVGGFGEPQLSVSDLSMIKTKTAAITLENVAPFANVFFVVGFSRIDLPFQGGTVVPSPDVYFPMTADASGRLHWKAYTGTMATGKRLYIQYWVADPSVPGGVSASNAIQITGQ